MTSDEPTTGHYIVKHDLTSLKAMPHFIWRTDYDQHTVPPRFNQVREKSLWIGFAYTSSDARERPLCLVTGFSECVHPAKFRRVPRSLPRELQGDDWARRGHAWMIEGKPWKQQPKEPVGVLPINDILSPKRVWNNQGIIPISSDDFSKIRQHALTRQFNSEKIALIGREPECEQELLAVVVSGYRKLGIEKILRVRKAFPDLLVQIDGKKVHLELEVYSKGFFSHGHDQQVRKRRFVEDGIPVAVLCWIDNCPEVKDRVSHFFELRSLIREGRTLTIR